jgi:carboxyl-terminal processing protease
MGRRALIWLAAAVAVGAAFGAGFEVHTRTLSSSGSSAHRGPLRAQVLAELEGHYYAPLPRGISHEPTVRTVIRALHDPYTQYLDPAEYRDLVESQEGGYAGVGLALARGRDGLVVRALLPGLPAYKAGIQPGDVITAVDQTDLQGVPYREAVGLIHGNAGTLVQLSVVRRGQHSPLLLTLERQPVRVTRVRAHTIGGGGKRFMYIRVPAFVDGSAGDIRHFVQAAARSHLRGVILDLRGNLGGLLSEAVATARVFVDQGVIVTTGSITEQQQTLVADGTAVRGAPRVAILIDGTTASAAEVVAGAIQRVLPLSRVVVVGSRSFGKGTVQAVHPLPNGGALKLTVAVFTLAGGADVNGRGVRPDLLGPDRPQTDVDETLQVALTTLGGL